MEAFGFFSKQIAEVITRIFFTVKAFKQLLRNFFEICRSNSKICALSTHCYFSFTKMIERSQKRKAAAIVINSYLSSAANCECRL